MPLPASQTGSRSKKGPRLIILVRHAQSEGNKNREIHQTVPDHRVKLTNLGWQQAYDAGTRLRAMLRADDTLQFFTSPYRRTRETTEGILQTLTSDDPEPSPFKRNNIKVYEEPRLREQDFGNFQPCSAEMERMWQERADYGHFFYRIPNGESAADAYDRVSGFNESLWRQFGEDDFPSVCVLVTHGLMSRVFLMKWYHFSVEYFEDLRNVNHCEFLIMRKQDSGKYTLENNLRTWSELRRERAALLKQKEKEEAASHGNSSSTSLAKDKDGAKLEKAAAALASAAVVPQRRWGGCPNGCNHDKNFKIRSGLADLIKQDGTAVYNDSSSTSSHVHSHSKTSASPVGSHTPAASLARRPPQLRRFQAVGYSDDDGDIDDDNRASSPVSADGQDPDEDHSKSKRSSSKARGGAVTGGGLVPSSIDVARAQEEIMSSPDATPSFITPEDRLRQAISPPPAKSFLHVGRDFGGTYSGHTSDADSSEDDRVRRRMARLKLSMGSGGLGAESAGHHHSTHHYHREAGESGVSAGAAGPAEVAAAVESKEESLVHMKRTRSMANRLGDVPHCSDCEDAADGDDDDLGDDETDVDHELRREEAEDRSIRGSVY